MPETPPHRACCHTIGLADAVEAWAGVAAARKAHTDPKRYARVTKEEFARWAASMRKLFPLNLTVRASIEDPGHDLVGVCWMVEPEEKHDPRYYVLRVCPKLDRHHAAETLLHEWVHLVRADEDPDAIDLHDAAYWEKYGEMYRAWHRTT